MPHIEGEYNGFKFNWEVTLRPDRKPISNERITCTSCGGRCRPHFGMIDDPEPCYFCNNTGTVIKSIEFNPKPPQDLVDQLSKVITAYWNKQQNDKFELTGD